MITGIQHQPRWKSWLSYLVDLPVGRWSSPENGEMELMLSKGEFKLCTANAVYSFGRHYRSFSRAFEILKIYEDASIRSVLVLGWGIGSIAELLDGHPTIERIKGVEYDQTLIDCFNKLGGEYSFKTDLECADGVDHVLKGGSGYDLVCSDIFEDDRTPPAVISAAYLKGLTALTRPGGRCLLSKLHQTVEDRRQNLELEANLLSAGIDFDVINTIGNRVYHWKV